MIADDATLSRLMGLAQAGDKQAYAVALEECRNWLKSYFRRRVPPDRIEDLVQEVLISLHSKRASYDPARPFYPWLAAIARYRWVDHLRKQTRAAESELVDDVAASPEEPAIAARLSLERLLAMLPEKQSEAIELVKLEGLTIAEASDRTGQSESLVKVNIHRGLKKLAALIEKE
jgi:RNA polymerase sigma-70 factor (ECF subfamily)